MEYKIAYAANMYALQEAVKKYITDGWQPIGGAVQSNINLMQTMIKPVTGGGGTRRKRRGKKHTRKR